MLQNYLKLRCNFVLQYLTTTYFNDRDEFNWRLDSSRMLSRGSVAGLGMAERDVRHETARPQKQHEQYGVQSRWSVHRNRWRRRKGQTVEHPKWILHSHISRSHFGNIQRFVQS